MHSSPSLFLSILHSLPLSLSLSLALLVGMKAWDLARREEHVVLTVGRLLEAFEGFDGNENGRIERRALEWSLIGRVKFSLFDTPPPSPQTRSSAEIHPSRPDCSRRRYKEIAAYPGVASRRNGVDRFREASERRIFKVT